MEFRHLGSVFALFCLALLGCHVQASLPAEDYWRSLWPTTPMPKALRHLTLPARKEREFKGRFQSEFTLIKYVHSSPASKDNELKGRIQPQFTPKNYGPTRKDGVPTELNDTLNVAFFFEHDLHPGKKLNLEFTKRDEITFLPDKVAKSIPFSSSRLPEILNHFNIKPESSDAEIVKSTLEICERPVIDEEDKYCATSMESMVKFTVSKLGKNIRVLSIVLEKESQKQQQYNVVKGVQKAGDKVVVCHKLSYPYAVFYCHKDAARTYTVPLVATDDGTKAKGLAVCHTDTTQWSPEHIAFRQLNVKPGTVPVCHFIATDTLLWVPH